MIKKIIFLFIFYLFFNTANAKEDFMILKLKNGEVLIELFIDIAPNHVKRIKKLANEIEKQKRLALIKKKQECID